MQGADQKAARRLKGCRPAIRPGCMPCRGRKSGRKSSSDRRSLLCIRPLQGTAIFRRKSIRPPCTGNKSSDYCYDQGSQEARMHPHPSFRSSPVHRPYDCRCGRRRLQLMLFFLIIMQVSWPFCAAVPTLSSTSLGFRPAQVHRVFRKDLLPTLFPTAATCTSITPFLRNVGRKEIPVTKKKVVPIILDMGLLKLCRWAFQRISSSDSI